MDEWGQRIIHVELFLSLALLRLFSTDLFKVKQAIRENSSNLQKITSCSPVNTLQILFTSPLPSLFYVLYSR